MSEKVEKQLYFGFQLSPNEILQDDEVFKPFDSDYMTLEGYAGVQFRLLDSTSFPGYLQTELSYGLTAGDFGNLGSSRQQGSFNVGWHQSIFKALYLEPKIGFSYNDNALNFGRGFEPEHEGSFNIRLQALTGIEISFSDNGSIVSGLGVGFFWEKVVAGSSYENQGLLFGLRFAFRAENADNYNEWEEAKKTADRLESQSKKLEMSLRIAEDRYKRAQDEYTKLAQRSASLESDYSKQIGLYFSEYYLFPRGETSIPTQAVKDPSGNELGPRNIQLDKIADWLLVNPGVSFKIHAFSTLGNSDKDDKEKCLQLAHAVQEYLIQVRGIQARRVLVDGYYEDSAGAIGSSLHGGRVPSENAVIQKCATNDCVAFEYFEIVTRSKTDFQIEEIPTPK